MCPGTVAKKKNLTSTGALTQLIPDLIHEFNKHRSIDIAIRSAVRSLVMTSGEESSGSHREFPGQFQELSLCFSIIEAGGPCLLPRPDAAVLESVVV